jgi:hypothetical protein
VTSLGTWAGLSLWLLASPASAASEVQQSSMRHIPFVQAPLQVQHDLIRTLATCGRVRETSASARRV